MAHSWLIFAVELYGGKTDPAGQEHMEHLHWKLRPMRSGLGLFIAVSLKHRRALGKTIETNKC